MSETDWQHWRTARAEEARGLLALTGTYWIDGETAVPGVPGVWQPSAAGGVELKAVAPDGLTLAGEPISGTVTLAPDVAGLHYGPVRLSVLVKDGLPVVRTWDPDSPALRAFAGIDAFPYDPGWLRPAVFTPYPAEQATAVPTADGRERDLVLAGEVAVILPDGTHTLAVSRAGDGLTAQFSDLTSGESTFKFRTLPLPAPDPDGSLVADFNRAYLPPCAFTDHYLCFFPPAGNRLDVGVTAGEKALLT
ncbi:DUF1684 domain-containing protein [Acrocarpospora catenulata]|uniref:DUF1684 domain-containing protein n=1 Tax=Acrocarpospora catenulata TaxID=2836182 RepID=UPI001BD992AF|nr:DUF1684 domain-containing protein [Acrocarpospora catenulata]